MEFTYQLGKEMHRVVLEESPQGQLAIIAGQRYQFEIIDQQGGQLVLRINNQIYDFHWAESEGKRWISAEGCTYQLEKPSGRMAASRQDSGAEDALRAPMPAQVREVLVQEGDEVQLGAPLLILEAMKMEIRLTAPGQARIAKITTAVGESVERDQVLIELEQM